MVSILKITFQALKTSIRYAILIPLSWLFYAVIRIRNKLYDKKIFKTATFPIKIISIGNISLGGTGKTPMAEFLIRMLLKQELKTAYLSRGYGRQTKGFRLVNPITDTVFSAGDEALQVAKKFQNIPVAVCEDRVKGVEELLNKFELDFIVLDDAFQHRRIHRDLDMVMIDANFPPWQDYLLPAGRLREPMSSLNRADIVVVNKMFENDKIRQFQKYISKDAVFTRTLPHELIPINPEHEKIIVSHQTKRGCIVFSGIGNNEQFLLEVRKLGFTILKTKQFPDHYLYRLSDIERIAKRYKKLQQQNLLVEEPVIVTTEKDYIRLITNDWFNKNFYNLPIYYLTIQIEIIRGKETFYESIKERFNIQLLHNDNLQSNSQVSTILEKI